MSSKVLAPATSGVAHRGALQAASLSWGARAAPFSSNVCDCCDNCGICCTTLFCPCQTYAGINKHLTGDEDVACEYCLACCFLPWGASCMAKSNRTKLRKVYGLSNEGACGGDCCIHCCCHCCAMCQEMREIDFRQDALHTTQRAASGPQVNQTVSVNQSMAMMQQTSGGYPQPPATAFVGAQLTSSPSQNQQIYRMPSGQLVMVSAIEPVSPHSMVSSSPSSSQQFMISDDSGSSPAQYLPAPSNPPAQQFIEKP